MKPLAIVGGSLIVLFTLRDIFHTVFHPIGTGAIGEKLSTVIWKAFRAASHLHHSLLSIAGPLSMVANIAAWALLLFIGWTLIFWTFLPRLFVYTNEIAGGTHYNFLDAMVLSSSLLVTLNVAELLHWSSPLALLLPLEALLGFGLFTASITWVLSSYPVLQRRQSAANTIAAIRDIDHKQHLSLCHTDPIYATDVVSTVAATLLDLRTDLLQFPVTYYFHALEDRDSLAKCIDYLPGLAEEASAPAGVPALQHAGLLLMRSLQDFCKTISEHHLHLPEKTPVSEVLAAYRRDHFPYEDTQRSKQ